MVNFIVIFLAFILGMCCKRIQKFPAHTGLSINLFVIYVSLPSLILLKFPLLLQPSDLQGQGQWWVPASMAWICFFLSWLVISFLAKKFAWSQAKTGALILTSALGNTSFVGFPLLEAMLGPQAVSVGILADQLGSFLVLSTLGIFVAAKYSGGDSHWWVMAKRILMFPPFIAVLTACVWSLTGLWGWEYLSGALDKLSATLVPLALFAVGFQAQFKWSVIRRRSFPLAIGLSLKLILFPLFFLVFYHHVLGINDFFTRVTILEAAMATQISSAVVATEFNLDSELANLMVALGIPLSLLTVPAWNYLVLS